MSTRTTASTEQAAGSSGELAVQVQRTFHRPWNLLQATRDVYMRLPPRSDASNSSASMQSCPRMPWRGLLISCATPVGKASGHRQPQPRFTGTVVEAVATLSVNVGHQQRRLVRKKTQLILTLPQYLLGLLALRHVSRNPQYPSYLATRSVERNQSRVRSDLAFRKHRLGLYIEWSARFQDTLQFRPLPFANLGRKELRPRPSDRLLRASDVALRGIGIDILYGVTGRNDKNEILRCLGQYLIALLALAEDAVGTIHITLTLVLRVNSRPEQTPEDENQRSIFIHSFCQTGSTIAPLLRKTHRAHKTWSLRTEFAAKMGTLTGGLSRERRDNTERAPASASLPLQMRAAGPQVSSGARYYRCTPHLRATLAADTASSNTLFPHANTHALSSSVNSRSLLQML